MADTNDRAYYEARARSARTLADAARDPGIRNIHEELARTYDLLAKDPGRERPTLRSATD